ncbi:MAG TPA: hypothetical protein PLX06_09895, partial [Fimbriimonadaceae bacterium]|nr:hypothetical protein [Fimbriimonadaceae bacterium]
LFDFAAPIHPTASRETPPSALSDWKPRKPIKGARYYRWNMGSKKVYAELLPAGLRYKHKPHWVAGNRHLNMLTLWTDSGWWVETECRTPRRKSLRIPTDAEQMERADAPIPMRYEGQRLDEAAFSQAKAFAKFADKPASEAAKWFMRDRVAPWQSEDFKVWGYTCRAQVQYGQLIVLGTHEEKADRWKDALWLEVDYVRERGKFNVWNAPIHGERVLIHEGSFGESANRFTLENQWEDPKFSELTRILGFAIGNLLASQEAA